MTKPKSLIAIAALAVAAAVFPASPAAAHDTCVAYGANVACVRSNHQMIDWCDREPDGRWVFAQYWYRGSPEPPFSSAGQVQTGVDSNGSRSGCGHQGEPRGISVFRVCEFGSGCSAWKNA